MCNPRTAVEEMTKLYCFEKTVPELALLRPRHRQYSLLHGQMTAWSQNMADLLYVKTFPHYNEDPGNNTS